MDGQKWRGRVTVEVSERIVANSNSVSDSEVQERTRIESGLECGVWALDQSEVKRGANT